jgi:hypothetical protein
MTLRTEKKFLTMREAAERLGYSYDYFQQIWPSLDGVLVSRIGRKLLFKTEDLDNYVEAHAIT